MSAGPDWDRAEAAVAELCARGRGLATFDADGVLWREDSGNSFLHWQIAHHRLTPQCEREAREGWARYERSDKSERDELVTAILCASVLRGLPEPQVDADARAFFDEHIRPHIVPQTAEWARRLERSGVEVWLVSGSHRWLIAAGARAIGVSDQRILPVYAAVENGICTSTVPEPVTYGAGKAAAIRARFLQMPDLAAGNTHADRHMLELARTAIAFEPDAELEALARRKGWICLRLRHQKLW